MKNNPGIQLNRGRVIWKQNPKPVKPDEKSEIESYKLPSKKEIKRVPTKNAEETDGNDQE